MLPYFFLNFFDFRPSLIELASLLFFATCLQFAACGFFAAQPFFDCFAHDLGLRLASEFGEFAHHPGGLDILDVELRSAHARNLSKYSTILDAEAAIASSC